MNIKANDACKITKISRKRMFVFHVGVLEEVDLRSSGIFTDMHLFIKLHGFTPQTEISIQ
jgi:hypothetical protein